MDARNQEESLVASEDRWQRVLAGEVGKACSETLQVSDLLSVGENHQEGF